MLKKSSEAIFDQSVPKSVTANNLPIFAISES